MQKAMKAVAWVLVVPLLAFVTQAQDSRFNPEDLLMAPFDSLLTRSSPAINSCVTPENEQGVCGFATACEVYQSQLEDVFNPTVLNFFLDRMCSDGPNFVHVCCPTRAPSLPPASRQPSRHQGTFIISDPSTAVRPIRPSQRPNNRAPGQSDNRGEKEEEEMEQEGEVEREFINDSGLVAPPSRNTAPLPLAPAPPQPIPTPPPTTTTLSPPTTVPQHTLIQSSGVLVTQDRGPVLETPDASPQIQESPPTEPPVPSILSVMGECGVHAQGGSAQQADPAQQPWVVGLGRLSPEEFRLLCIGALISHLHVIVAARCMHAHNLTHVRLGVVMSAITGKDEEILDWSHPGFNPATRENDLALLTLANPVSYTDNIRPVCLPFPYRLDGFVGQNTHAVGWNGVDGIEAGLVQLKGLDSCRKAYQSQDVISNNKVSLFPQLPSSPSSEPPAFILNSRSASIPLVVDRRHLCGSPAISTARPTDCLSVFGAPLFYHDQDTTGKHYLVGVSAPGVECREKPGLYTRIGAFLPWLAKQLSSVQATSPRHAPIPPLMPNLNPARRTQGVEPRLFFG